MATRGNANTVAEGNVVIRGDLAPVQQELRTLPAQVGGATDKAQQEVRKRGGLFGGFFGRSGGIGSGVQKLFGLLGGAGIVGGAFALGREIRERFTGEQQLTDVREALFEAQATSAEDQAKVAAKIVKEKGPEARIREEALIRRGLRVDDLTDRKFAEAVAKMQHKIEAGLSIDEAADLAGLGYSPQVRFGLKTRAKEIKEKISEDPVVQALREAQEEQNVASGRLVRAQAKTELLRVRDLLQRIADRLDDIYKRQDEQTDKFFESQQLSAGRFDDGFRELARTNRR